MAGIFLKIYIWTSHLKWQQVEWQTCIKFCVKLAHSSTETIWMIQKPFGDNAMSEVQIKVLHIRFKDDWKSVESDPCSGWPATSRASENVECVQPANNKDWWLIMWELEADLGIPKTTVSKIWMQYLAWNMLCQNLSHGFCYQSRRNIMLQLLMMWFKLPPMNQISSRRS